MFNFVEFNETEEEVSTIPEILDNFVKAIAKTGETL